MDDETRDSLKKKALATTDTNAKLDHMIGWLASEFGEGRGGIRDLGNKVDHLTSLHNRDKSETDKRLSALESDRSVAAE